MPLFLTLNDLKLIALEKISCIFSDDFYIWAWGNLWSLGKIFMVCFKDIHSATKIAGTVTSNAKYTRRNKKIKNIYHSTYLHRVYRGEGQ